MGLKPCLKCMNALAPGRRLPPGYCSMIDGLAECAPLHQEDLEQVLAHLEEQTVASRLKLHETLLGWKREDLKHSFLSCSFLSQWCPVDNVHFDPMHLYWSNGVVGQQLGLFFASVRKLTRGCLVTHMQQYARLWTSMPGNTTTAAACISGKLFRDDADYRGDASQCIAAYSCAARGCCFRLGSAATGISSAQRRGALSRRTVGCLPVCLAGKAPAGKHTAGTPPFPARQAPSSLPGGLRL